jgi:hypothetical protein
MQKMAVTKEMKFDIEHELNLRIINISLIHKPHNLPLRIKVRS